MMENDLMLLGIDLEYRRYLSNYDNDRDYFGIVLDRDFNNHSRTQLIECLKHCNENNYGMFITNPCFEFWLLLHMCDVEKEYSEDEMEKMRINAHVSLKRTQVSFELSKHGISSKTISAVQFNKYCLPNIGKAIVRAEKFAKEPLLLLDQMGSNLPELFKIIGYPEVYENKQK